MNEHVPTPSPQRVRSRRTKKLIDPSLQMRLSFQFLAVSASALLLQYVLFSYLLASLSMEFPGQSQALFGASYRMMLWSFLITMFVFLPLTTLLGVRVTHRVAGPIYRFKKFLRAVERGERPEDCRLRKDDMLQDFCHL